MTGMAPAPPGDETTRGATRTLGAAGARRFVATWQGVPHYAAGGAVTFQVVLSESDGSITFSYQDVTFGSASVDAGASATVGVESVDGLEGTQVSFDAPNLTAPVPGAYAKPVPVMTTVVPPAVGPLVGVTAFTVGAAT